MQVLSTIFAERKHNGHYLVSGLVFLHYESAGVDRGVVAVLNRLRTWHRGRVFQISGSRAVENSERDSLKPVRSGRAEDATVQLRLITPTSPTLGLLHRAPHSYCLEFVDSGATSAKSDDPFTV